MKGTSKRRRPAGRPPKFAEARRPVTVTLPERTLRQLEALDADRARAIVKAAEATAAAGGRGQSPSVRLVEVEPGTAIIVVGPSRTLRRMELLRLVEVAPSRYLLALPPGTPTESIEVALLDALESLAPDETAERLLLNELRAGLRDLRHRRVMSKAEIIFVATERGARRRAAG
jgi:hypothetical protein